MSMTVADLIAELEGCDPNAEVRLAHQPNWPFEYGINQVVEVDIGQPDDDERANAEEAASEGDEGAEKMIKQWEEREPTPVVYIAEASQIGYLPGAVANAIGWGRR